MSEKKCRWCGTKYVCNCPVDGPAEPPLPCEEVELTVYGVDWGDGECTIPMVKESDALALIRSLKQEVAEQKKRRDADAVTLERQDQRNARLQQEVARLTAKLEEHEKAWDGLRGCYRETTTDSGTKGLMIHGFAEESSPVAWQIQDAEHRFIRRKPTERKPYTGPSAYCMKEHGGEPWCFMQCADCARIEGRRAKLKEEPSAD